MYIICSLGFFLGFQAVSLVAAPVESQHTAQLLLLKSQELSVGKNLEWRNTAGHCVDCGCLEDHTSFLSQAVQ